MTTKNNSQAPLSYADAGVSIEEGDALVEHIKPLAKSTDRPGTMGGIGGFGAVFDLKAAGFKDPLLVSSTDGVGTKLKLAIDANRHETIGIDLVAMCVNDLVVQGAEPLFFLDYFATSKLVSSRDPAIIKGIAEGCRIAGCALSGGETAEMPGMYAKGDYDLAGFAVGAVERDQLLPAGDIKEGDVLLGLASSGVHSNGYSLVRRILEKQKLAWDAPLPFAPGKNVADVFLAPTRIYVKPCLEAIRSGGVKALAHITGGGLTENIPRVLPKNLAAEIHWNSWQRPAVFTWLEESGPVELAEMRRTFNCGIGMVLAVDPARADALKALLAKQGETVHKIGRLVPRAKDAVVFTE